MTTGVPATGNLTDDVVNNARDAGDRVQFSRPGADGWEDVTAAGFLAEVSAVAKGLIAAGIEVGDRVALVSKTRYEWTLLDYAIWFAGAVSVPIYETSSAEQTQWILSDSGASAVVVEGDAHLRMVEELRDRVPLRHVWCLGHGDVEELCRRGQEVPEDELEGRRMSAQPDSLATIVYTSGSTDRPKGCMLSHGNFMFELGVALEELDDLFAAEQAATLLMLPLAHVFARVVQVGAVSAQVRLGYSADVRGLLPDLEEFRPTFVLSVPRVFEKVFTKASQQAAADGRGRTFGRAAETAIAYSRALDGGRPNPWLRVRHALFDRFVFARLRETWGGRCRYAVSGGAPLGERLAHFYRGIGLTILEGYGLTETTAAVTVN